MSRKIRTVEASTQDVFVNVNDLLLDIMRSMDKAKNDAERLTYKKLVNRLTDIRDRTHDAHSNGK